ncbi:MAG TPA: ATP phosphoribosyltransferase regulatory subunit [Alphaproteobacteria bacterium]|nr:ATP phosphoribosyltransferase regulatory subunit [Alphaproteobacteria bacterium]
MNDHAKSALLPAGLQDLLPPDADHEARLIQRLLATLAAHGYELVKPPLVEFEEGLLSGPGAAMAADTFRMMDPVSQRMMGVRADMTPQIARLATTRLATAPRPLRLSYAGDVLRVRGSQLRPERQFVQVGAELIGSASAEADAEAVLLAAEALGGIGVTRLSVDLNSPTLIQTLCKNMGCGPLETARLRAALDRKDAAEVAGVGGPASALCAALLNTGGNAAVALDALAAIDLPPDAAADAKRLGDVAKIVCKARPSLAITIDPVEYRGFEYQTGVSFTIFARGVRGELGRGGRYVAGNGAVEPATGFTLFLDTVVRAVGEPKTGRRLFLPLGTPAEARERARADGWITLAGLDAVADPRTEGRRLACTHVWQDGAIVAIE